MSRVEAEPTSSDESSGDGDDDDGGGEAEPEESPLLEAPPETEWERVNRKCGVVDIDSVLFDAESLVELGRVEVLHGSRSFMMKAVCHCKAHVWSGTAASSSSAPAPPSGKRRAHPCFLTLSAMTDLFGRYERQVLWLKDGLDEDFADHLAHAEAIRGELRVTG